MAQQVIIVHGPANGGKSTWIERNGFREVAANDFNAIRVLKRIAVLFGSNGDGIACVECIDPTSKKVIMLIEKLESVDILVTFRMVNGREDGKW